MELKCPSTNSSFPLAARNKLPPFTECGDPAEVLALPEPSTAIPKNWLEDEPANASAAADAAPPDPEPLPADPLPDDPLPDDPPLPVDPELPPEFPDDPPGAAPPLAPGAGVAADGLLFALFPAEPQEQISAQT